jgi:hypothetical protein
MTKKKDEDEEDAGEDNPKPSESKKPELPLGEKVLYSMLGFASGMGVHHFAGFLRPKIEETIQKKLPDFRGEQVGGLTTLLGLMLPESEWKYFIASSGVGISVDDVFFRTFKKCTYPQIDITTTGSKPETELIKRYSYMLHIDETLPVTDKEAIILPEFPAAVHSQRENPLQSEAIQTIIKECKIDPHKTPTLTDLYWMQQWFLYWGIYEGNEGLWPGHDRIRTAAKLLRVRDSGERIKDGHSAFLYDCIPRGEHILLTDGKAYLTAPVESAPFMGYKAVSYNFSNGSWEPQEITHTTSKGKMQIYKVKLANGTSFRCTKNHPIMQRMKGEEFEKVPLSETKSIRGKKYPHVAVVRKLPELNTDSPLTEKQLWVLGHYVAEGWKSGINTFTSGYGDKVPEMLDAAGVDYGLHHNSNGVPMYYFKKGNDMLNYLEEFGSNSHNKRIPDWISGLPTSGIQSVLDGYCYGDGHIWTDKDTDSRGYNRNNKLNYSTVSTLLTRDLRILHWVLGNPLYTSYIKDAMGFTHSPIYRMYQNPESVFNREVMPGISSVGIKSIEPDGEDDVYDITVDKNHNFVLADSGAIGVNCDDGATVVNQVMDYFGFPTKYALISQKPELVDGVHALHHIFPLVKARGRLWMVETIKQAPVVPLEFCYEIFKGLQRVVVVNDDGTYYDYAKWKEYRIKSLSMNKKKKVIVE